MAQDVAPTAAIHFRERMLPAKRRGAARDREAAKRARGRTWVVTGVCMTANSARSDECRVGWTEAVGEREHPFAWSCACERVDAA